MLKKELIKNGIILAIILSIAVGSTYYIYHKFQNDRSVDFDSESLTIVFHDSTGDKVSIKKVTPVTDSVGLSSNSYSFDIINNLTIEVPYQIRIVPDTEAVLEDECEEIMIPEDDIRVSIKIGRGEHQIYTLSELEEGILVFGTVPALKKEPVSIRLWIDKDSTLPAGSKMHYHGIIKVVEDKMILDMNG